MPSSAFVAWEQSGGKGRQGRAWSSSAGLGLYVTFVLEELELEKIRQLPMAIAVIVARVVEGPSVAPRIKWPNDVQSRGRKLAGILLEAATRGDAASTALVGIGINVHHSDGEIPLPEATSLALEGDSGHDMAQLAYELSEAISGFGQSTESLAEVVARYRPWSAHRVGDHLRCRVANKEVEGDFEGFDEDGALLLCQRGRVIRLAASEIVES